MRSLLLTALGVACVACSAEPPPWTGPELAQPRSRLTVGQLLDAELPPFVDTSFLARPAWADEALEPFVGTLDLGPAELELDFPATRALYPGEHRFPAVSLGFVAHQGQLVPADRARIAALDGSDSLWDVLVGTGAVWHEADDGDWSRASFPIDLVDRYFNQVRNCVGTFVYRRGEASPVYLQCGQETADADDEQLGDLRAIVPASVAPLTTDVGTLLDAHARRQAHRLPTRPLAELDSGGELAAIFDRSLLTRASTSVGAVFLDGTLYVHPPQTRHGPHPYPDEMHHGVYSVTKSLAGALAMFALAERYGDELFDARITDHVPALADRDGWEGVTFAHALDMATGTRGGEASELLYEPLVLAADRHEAIANIAALGDAPEAPGDAFRYATTNTFVLSVALQHFVEEREGPDVRFWDLVREQALDPIGAGDLDLLLTRDPDPARRIPYLGFGARPTLDQAAKIALLFANGGEHHGEQLLHRGRVREALGRTGWEGLRVDGRTRYRHAFWSRAVRVGGCRVEVPFLQGHGGNHVLLLPGGALVFRFMDEQDDDVAGLARAIESRAPSCPR